MIQFQLQKIFNVIKREYNVKVKDVEKIKKTINFEELKIDLFSLEKTLSPELLYMHF